MFTMTPSPRLLYSRYYGKISRLFHRRLVSAAPHETKGLTTSPFNTAWLTELGITPHVIIDAGSFDGNDALRFKAAFPTSRVIAVEADPERVQTISINVAEREIDFVGNAIGDRDGELDWYQATVDGHIDAQGSLYRQTAFLNRRFPNVKQFEEPIKVECKRLDTLCRELGIEAIDLLHMDIQGAEFAALSGLGPLRPKTIFLEVLDNGWIGAESAAKIHALLRSFGYRLAADLKGDRFYALSSLLKK